MLTYNLLFEEGDRPWRPWIQRFEEKRRDVKWRMYVYLRLWNSRMDRVFILLSGISSSEKEVAGEDIDGWMIFGFEIYLWILEVLLKLSAEELNAMCRSVQIKLPTRSPVNYGDVVILCYFICRGRVRTHHFVYSL